uniref:Uncharacterized protein n=1 Tax=Leersia perrieri TaxID=77586 RepID=A0A0D9W893_9ORYZ
MRRHFLTLNDSYAMARKGGVTSARGVRRGEVSRWRTEYGRERRRANARNPVGRGVAVARGVWRGEAFRQRVESDKEGRRRGHRASPARRGGVAATAESGAEGRHHGGGVQRAGEASWRPQSSARRAGVRRGGEALRPELLHLPDAYAEFPRRILGRAAGAPPPP